ncbi:MAG TPA: YdcF family protein [Aliidongia sp.]|nr:YdcF family protein [Aliidongia sp.]
MSNPFRSTGRAMLAGLVILAALLLGGLAWFIHNLDQPGPDPDRVTDAIIVLTGGSLRIESGFALLAEGKAKKLFISGVHPGVDTAEMLRLDRSAPKWVECCVVLGHTADNTVGNAIESAEWLRRENYHSIRLVTASYHMPRALLEFRRVLPADIAIVIHPVFPEAVRNGGVGPSWTRPGRVVVVEYLKYLGALIRPLLPSQPPGSAPI